MPNRYERMFYLTGRPNRQPSEYQADAHLNELPGPALSNSADLDQIAISILIWDQDLPRPACPKTESLQYPNIYTCHCQTFVSGIFTINQLQM